MAAGLHGSARTRSFSDASTRISGAAFPREVVEASPYRIHTVPTDSGMAFRPAPEPRTPP